MPSILLAFLAETGLITWRDISGKDPAHTIAGLPIPSDYLAAVAIFGVLGLVPKDSPAAKVAGLFGWGIVIATTLNLFPGTPKSAKASSSTTTTSSSTSSASAKGAKA